MTTVWVDSTAVETIQREAVRRRVRETGGAMFGYEGEGGVVVACAYGPGSKAKHGRTSFTPDPATTRGLMDAVRSASDGRYGFVGSWHTHPRAAPLPSTVDRATAIELSEQDDLFLPQPVLLIQSTKVLGRRVSLGELRAWRWDRSVNELRPAELRHVELSLHLCPDE